MSRIVAVDYGLARLGIALSDEQKIIVAKSFAMKAEKKANLTAVKLHEILQSYTVEKIIIGLPLHLNGKKGFLADETLHFISCLEKLVNIPIVPIDERLSTCQAEKVLREANLNRKKRAGLIDAVTATILLECYLDSLSIEFAK